jgi:hypothetical protein
MKQTDKIIVAILSIWTFIHCYLMLIADNSREVNVSAMYDFDDGIITDFSVYKTSMFYPFTKLPGNTERTTGYFRFDFYDYTEFFVYVIGAWLCFLLYKLLSLKK